jgi:hypothetical protein
MGFIIIKCAQGGRFMRITENRLRQIIREEMLSEAGFGDVRVAEDQLQSQADKQAAKDLTSLWYDYMRSQLSVSDIADTREFINDRMNKIPSAYALLGKVDAPKFKRDVAALKPTILANFDKLMGDSLEDLGIDPVLIEKEIRPLYAEWVNIMAQAALYMMTLHAHRGEFLFTGRWNGIQNLGSWLGQEFKRLGLSPDTNGLTAKNVQDTFMTSIEPLTGLVKNTLYNTL